MRRNVSLKLLNTFGLDVSSAYYFKVNDLTDLEQLRKSHVIYDEKHIVIGGGSNCLFLDDYYEGLVLHIDNKGICINDFGNGTVHVSAAAGEDWTAFVASMVKLGYGGLENLSLIPGKVGAAPMQNIGAYGVEVKDAFYRLQAYDLQSGALVDFDKDACEFGYRSSIFNTFQKNRFVILSVEFILQKNPDLNFSYGSIKQELMRMKIENPSVADVSAAVINIRKSKLPDPAILGNAGSFFKNPVVHHLVFEDLMAENPDIIGYPENNDSMKLAAGWLIEKAGWKGYRIGDAGVHANQALVLVNYGNATGRDIFELAMRIRQSVKEKFGIELEPEVNII